MPDLILSHFPVAGCEYFTTKKKRRRTHSPEGKKGFLVQLSSERRRRPNALLSEARTHTHERKYQNERAGEQISAYYWKQRPALQLLKRDDDRGSNVLREPQKSHIAFFPRMYSREREGKK